MATEALERPTRAYDKPTIERALAEVAYTGGSCTIASRRLRDAGLDIPRQTLEFWKTEGHTQLYAEIQAEVAPRIRERVADECESLAVAYAQAERDTLATFSPQDLDAKDRPGAIRNLATAKAINVDKMQLLRDKPTTIVQKQDAEELLRALAIDTTAEDLPPSR